MKVSDRALELLQLIQEHTGEDGSFWMSNRLRDGGGRGNDDWCDELHDHLNVSGPGDCRILDSLKSKGFTIRPRTNLDYVKHLYQITDLGRRVLADNYNRIQQLAENRRRDKELRARREASNEA